MLAVQQSKLLAFLYIRKDELWRMVFGPYWLIITEVS